jgi:hypothetical protein
MSPVKELSRQSSSFDFIETKKENTIKHKAAIKFKDSMNKTLNP